MMLAPSARAYFNGGGGGGGGGASGTVHMSKLVHLTLNSDLFV
jgi:hypothetical protein